MTDKPYQTVHFESPFRQEAEKRVANSTKTDYDLNTPETPLHELLVHQIELEMQNESLKQAQQNIEASRDRYRELFDFAPIGYLTLTRDNLITDANLTAAKLLGVDRNQLLGVHFQSLVVIEYREFWHRHFMLIQQSGGNHACELEMRRSDNSTFYAKLDYQLFTGSINKSELRVALTDISQQKQDEPARIDNLLQNQFNLRDQLFKVAAAVPGVICSFRLGSDGSASMPYASPALESLYGITRKFSE